MRETRATESDSRAVVVDCKCDTFANIAGAGFDVVSVVRGGEEEAICLWDFAEPKVHALAMLLEPLFELAGCLAEALDAVDAVDHRLGDDTEVCDVVKEKHRTRLTANEPIPGDLGFLIVLVYCQLQATCLQRRIVKDIVEW
jgi:hypothetical protein